MPQEYLNLTSGCTGQISAVTFFAQTAKKPPSKICSVSRALEGAGMSLKDLLSDEPFSYRAAKSGLVQISYNGKIVATLSGRNSSRFLANVSCADSESTQLTMAKVTGHFKHGSERVSKNHIRNS